MFQAVAKQDAIALANTLTRTLIRWICELNFGPDVSAVFEFDVDEYASWDTIKSAIELGIPISKSTLYREYNIPEPEDPNDAFVSPKVQPQGSTLLFADIDKKKRKFLRIS
jgi:phage gp29-like protein